MSDTISNRRTEVSRDDCPHDHDNPYCQCNTSREERSQMLREFLDALSPVSSNPRLMPLGDDGKNPIIKGECRLNTDEAKSFLVSGEEAVRRIREEGENGFFIYAGKPEHGTEELVFADRDDPSRWPFIDDTLRVLSGSGEGDHETYINAGKVQNAEGKGELDSAGGVRAHNWGVVVPGSIHPSGGIYDIVSTPGIAKLHADDLPQELRKGTISTGSLRETEPKPLDPEDIETLPEDFDADSVTNEWGVSLREVRIVSGKLDKLLAVFNPGDDYESTSEADMATVSMLLIWGFSENDIANVLRAYRARKKIQMREDYIRRTIRQTALTKTVPLDPALGRALVESAKQNGGRPTVHEATLLNVKVSLQLLGGEATVSQLVDKGVIDWKKAKRSSVMKRVRRALKVLENAGYTSRMDRGVTLWCDDGLDSLLLPHE